MHKLICLFMSLSLLAGCTEAVNRQVADNANNTKSTSDAILSDDNATSSVDNANKPHLGRIDTCIDGVFVFQNDTISQRLEVEKTKRDEIKFRLYISNSLRRLSDTLIGIAKIPPDNYGLDNIEVDTDEDDAAYYVQLYVNEDRCYVQIRIDLNEFRRSRVFSAYNKSFVPIESVGIMNRQK